MFTELSQQSQQQTFGRRLLKILQYEGKWKLPTIRRALDGNRPIFYKFKCYPKEAATMKNILRGRPRTVANRPTSGGWGNKKFFFRPTAAGQGLIGGKNHTMIVHPAMLYGMETGLLGQSLAPT